MKKFFHYTAEGRQFWSSQDCTPETLVGKVKHSTFVAVDVGAPHLEVIADIGVAVLPSFPDALLDTPLNSLSTLWTLHGAQIKNLRISQPPLQHRNVERQICGSEDSIKADEIKTSLITILEQAKGEAQTLGNDLVLVLFSASSDLSTLVKLCPEMFSFFAWWTDLQAVVSDMDQDQASKSLPSLRDTLSALGLLTFGASGCTLGKGYNNIANNSANDALRTLAVLAGAVRMFRAGAKFHVKPPARPQKRPYNPATHKKYFRGCRPRPEKLYPFVAKLRLAFDSAQPLPDKKPRRNSFFPREYGEGVDLFQIFAKYQPTAVGRRYIPSNAGVWVSLPTREILQQFICDHHDKETKGGRLYVRDLSVTDDSDMEVAMTREEYDTQRRAEKSRNKENSKEDVDDIGDVIFMAEAMSLED